MSARGDLGTPPFERLHVQNLFPKDALVRKLTNSRTSQPKTVRLGPPVVPFYHFFGLLGSPTKNTAPPKQKIIPARDPK